ncbi:MAG: GNAT family N-acetyltransferase [Dongiaceae bacterium]
MSATRSRPEPSTRRGFALRPASPADAPAIADVLRAAFAAYDGLLQPRPGALSETAESIAAAFADHRGFVALPDAARADAVGVDAARADAADGRAVGSVLYRREGEGLYLGRLGVLPPWHGKGVGAALVEQVLAAGRAEGAGRVILNVRILLPANVAFFRRLGFREAALGTHAGFSAPTYHVMERRLP